MDPKIASRFNDNILHTAMRRYDIAPDQIKLLDGFESFIYEFNRPDGDYILRIGHSLRRTAYTRLGCRSFICVFAGWRCYDSIFHMET